MSEALCSQKAILDPAGRLGRLLWLRLCDPERDPRPGLRSLRDAIDPASSVIGVGTPLAAKLAASVAGLRAFPALSGPGCGVPSTQEALLCVLLGDDRGDLLHRGREVVRALAPVFELAETLDTFTYREGRDLTGYVDGTENPKGAAAATAALVTGRGPGLDGGSFVAVQRFVHDLDRFGARSQKERDATVGRALDTNEELGSAPASAHVKRSAQESYDPPAFMLRRSMPFADPDAAGLCFIAYGESLDRFERVLRRMLGLDDGVVDALFSFTRATSGGYYFCPPMREGLLDLRALGMS